MAIPPMHALFLVFVIISDHVQIQGGHIMTYFFVAMKIAGFEHPFLS